MTPEREKHLWETLKLFGVAAIFVSPFWFLAGDLKDGDEVLKTGLTLGIAGVGAAYKWVRG